MTKGSFPKLPAFHDVISSHWEDDWRPSTESVSTLRGRLQGMLPPANQEHGELCIVTAAQTYVAACNALSPIPSGEVSERREAIGRFLEEERSRFRRLANDLPALRRLAFGLEVPDRAYRYLRDIEPSFFLNWIPEEIETEWTPLQSAVAELERWVGPRLNALEVACEGMSSRGQKESTPEQTLAIVCGKEWKHLSEGHSLNASRRVFFEVVVELLVANGKAPKMTVEQLVKAYENHA